MSQSRSFPRRIIRTMKVLIFLMSLAFLQAQASAGLAQRINLDMRKASLSNVFKEIKRQSGYLFWYEQKLLQNTEPVDVRLKNATLKEALDLCLRGQPLEYSLVGNTVVINAAPAAPAAPAARLQQSVSGQVTDKESGEPLPGVSVQVKGSTQGTSTDLDGNYSLDDLPAGAVLVFTYVGYQTQEVPADGQSRIDVALATDLAKLDEVIVIGYGTQKKSDLTGSVARVEGEDLSNSPAPRVDQLLQGRAPGVNVTAVNGSPGARASIRIRGGNSVQGDNEPLYVIDGFIAGTSFNLNNINVNDIESIDILKDASAIAIYGTRGANGVILITTKSGAGVQGGKPQVSFNSYTGFQQLARKIDLLNGIERAEYGYEYAEFSGESNPFVDESLIGNTDWQDEITRTGMMSNMDISVRGNSDRVSYYISGNYFNQQGIIDNSGLNRYNFRSNLDFKLSDVFSAGARINTTFSKSDNSLVNLWTARLALTSFPLYNQEGGYWDENYVQGGPFDNPRALLDLNRDHTLENNLLGNFYVEIRPFENLTIRSTLGPQLNWRKNNTFLSGNMPSRSASLQGGRGIVNTNYNVQLLQENTVTYTKEFSDSRLELLGGFTWQQSRTEGSTAQTDGLPNDVVSFDMLDLGDPSTFRISSSFADPFQIVSWIGRANYSLKDKYLFTVAGRVDGSSRFASSRNKYAFFPSAAFAWRLSEEDFIRNMGLFDHLKLRLSYGKSGSQSINAFSTLAILQSEVITFNDEQFTGVRRARPANPDLRWETTSQFDAGLEMGFFNNRLNLELDYYYKKTVDLLLNRELPRQTGFEQRLENIGSLQNQGLELMIRSVNIDKENFSWSSTLTLAGNRSKVLELGGVNQIDIHFLDQGGPAAKLVVGEPVGVFTGLHYLGTWKSQEEIDEHGYQGLRAVVGGPRFSDTDGDGQISFNDDFVIIGNPEPTMFGGLLNTFQWKSFTLDIMLQGTIGNEVYNEFSQRGFFGRSDQNIYGLARDRWTEENPTSDIPRAGGTVSISDIPSNTVLVEDGSHLRLKNVQLSYQVPVNSVKWLSGLSVFLNGSNLWLWSDFRGYDPEAMRFGPGASNEYAGVIRGIIRSEYPNARTFTLGLNANF